MVRMQGKLYGGSRYKGVPHGMKKEMEKSLETTCNLLTRRSGGSDRTLPPSVWSIPERSNSSGIVTGRVRWTPTGRARVRSPSLDVFMIDRMLKLLLIGH